MDTGIDSPTYEPDPAGVFGAAHSLWEACQERAEQDHGLTLSESYNGFDQFMREVMRVANLFEEWACVHVDFNRMADVWPYLLLDSFGEVCLAAIAPSKLAEFNEDDCLRVALRLELPILRDAKLPVPVDVVADNPVPGSAFKKFRIQTWRATLEEGDAVPYVAGDEPFDENFGAPYFAVYGVFEDGTMEHIADRTSYKEAVDLVRKLAPGTFTEED